MANFITKSIVIKHSKGIGKGLMNTQLWAIVCIVWKWKHNCQWFMDCKTPFGSLQSTPLQAHMSSLVGPTLLVKAWL